MVHHSRNAHICDEFLVTNQNRVTEQFITMINFFAMDHWWWTWALIIYDELWYHHRYYHWTPHDIIIDHTRHSHYSSMALYFRTVTNTTSTLNQSLICDALFLNYNKNLLVIKPFRKTKVLKCLSFLIMVSRKLKKHKKN